MDNPTIKINEIFLSIPEEGSHAKNPNIYIRVSSGNLHITEGDHSNQTWKGTVFTLDEVLEQIRHNPTQFVRVLGEDPLSQKGTYSLIAQLLERKYLVSLELKLEHLEKEMPKGITKILEVPVSQLDQFKPHRSKLTKNDSIRFLVNTEEEMKAAQKYCLDENLLTDCEVLFHGAAGVFLNLEEKDATERRS